jgi:hypothetical protein
MAIYPCEEIFVPPEWEIYQWVRRQVEETVSNFMEFLPGRQKNGPLMRYTDDFRSIPPEGENHENSAERHLLQIWSSVCNDQMESYGYFGHYTLESVMIDHEVYKTFSLDHEIFFKYECQQKPRTWISVTFSLGTLAEIPEDIEMIEPEPQLM